MDLFIMLCVVVVAFMAIRRTHRKVSPVPANAPEVAETQEDRQTLALRLTIPGVNRVKLDPTMTGWVRGFNIPMKKIVDMAKYSQPGTISSFPDEVRKALLAAYHEGSGIGTEVMETIHYNRKLEENESLWFVLLNIGTPVLMALICRDKPLQKSPPAFA